MYMKQLFFLIFLCTSAFTFSQTEGDYEAVITSFTKSYNNQNSETIFNLFTSELQSTLSLDKLKANFAEVKKNQGEMSEATFLLDDEKGKSYLISFENGDMLLTLLLDSDKKIKIFELKEY